MFIIYRLIFNIVGGVSAALAWLFYYLRKDVRPEPASMVLKVFIWGSLIALPILLVQLGLSALLAESKLPPFVISILYWFFIIAFTEEFFKYLVVRKVVLNSRHLDEPLDLMIYMIVAALGFAALENTLYLFFPVGNLSFNQILNSIIIISFVRFIGATFLHTLTSGALGYFLAVEIYEIKKRGWFFIFGLLLATTLHGFYN